MVLRGDKPQLQQRLFIKRHELLELHVLDAQILDQAGEDALLMFSIC